VLPNVVLLDDTQLFENRIPLRHWRITVDGIFAPLTHQYTSNCQLLSDQY
jgi:hypothetical protein